MEIFFGINGDLTEQIFGKMVIKGILIRRIFKASKFWTIKTLTDLDHLKVKTAVKSMMSHNHKKIFTNY